MYLTFRNISTQEKVIVIVENQRYIINPLESIDVFCQNENPQFTTQPTFFSDIEEAVNEIDSTEEVSSRKEKLLAKLAKIFIKKIPEAILNISITYAVNCDSLQSVVVNLFDGIYSVCDGFFADFLDMVPVAMVFSRAETVDGTLKIVDVESINRKKYLKLWRNILLFTHWGLLFLNLTLFIPEYLTVRYFSSNFYLKKLFRRLYGKTLEQRAQILFKKEQKYEKEEKSGCLKDFLFLLVIGLLLFGLIFWASTSDPDVIVSEDLNTVVCFDETFVKTSEKLPSDAEKQKWESYSAHYTLPDGDYDSDSYYCYIYETPDGTRYMWLKEDYEKEENVNKDYKDYENPLIYKSTNSAVEN